MIHRQVKLCKPVAVVELSKNQLRLLHQKSQSSTNSFRFAVQGSRLRFTVHSSHTSLCFAHMAVIRRIADETRARLASDCPCCGAGSCIGCTSSCIGSCSSASGCTSGASSRRVCGVLERRQLPGDRLVGFQGLALVKPSRGDVGADDHPALLEFWPVFSNFF